MVALPAAMPVTKPLELTVATLVLLLLHVTVLFVALVGATVAVNCCVPPTAIDALVGDIVTPVTATVDEVTVTAQVAVLEPSWVVTVIVAVPAALPVTKPDVLTVAIAVLLLVQVTVLFVAFAGATVAVSCVVPFTATETDVGLIVTPVTGTLVDVLTVTLVNGAVHNVPSACDVTARPKYTVLLMVIDCDPTDVHVLPSAER
jgi:hypothetical protein